jgi:hypothetical protein
MMHHGHMMSETISTLSRGKPCSVNAHPLAGMFQPGVRRSLPERRSALRRSGPL